MPQLAVIQPATPKDAPQTRAAGTPGGKEQNTFSPHLEKAVSNNKKQQTVQNESRTLASVKTDPAGLSEDTTQLAQAQAPEETLEEAVAQITGEADTADLADGQDISVAKDMLPVSEAGNQPSIMVNPAVSQQQQIEPTVQQHPNTPVVPVAGGDITVRPHIIIAELSSAGTEPTIDKALKPPAAMQQNALIDQLQRIIDQADETGTVSITKATDPTSMNSIRNNVHGVLLPTPDKDSAPVPGPKSTETSGTTLTGLPVADTENTEKAGARADQQLTGSRYVTQQQYLNPKIADKDFGDNKQNFHDSRQGDQLPLQTGTTGSQIGSSNTLSNGMEQTSTFSQVATTAQQTAAQQTDETARPILLPSGTIVQEEEIIQQLSHRMQISSRHMDSRINLKLHPAELGSLKIDLTVKEGSIRANVVAQSQHTTEILEKNLAKLKTVLESQGFTVDEISISAESESVGDFDLFERQLFGQNDSTPKARKERREEESIFTMADNIFAAPAIHTGVNVKI